MEEPPTHCWTCKALLSEKERTHEAYGHEGLCCDCFDVSQGMHPPVKLGVPTVARLPTDDDEELA